jgi:sec-independent protein translocase protein TatC
MPLRLNRNQEPAKEMTFFDHFEALRWHLVRSIIVILLFAIAAFIRKDLIFDEILLAPKNPSFITFQWLCQLGELTGIPDICVQDFNFKIINTEMTGQFMAHIWISLIAGLILGSPYLIWEIWRFIKPALYDKEKRSARGFVAITTFLFLTGIAFGYFILTPVSVNFLGTYMISNQVDNYINLQSYVSIVTVTTLITGVVFELPVVVYFLSRIGILTPQFMRKYRRHAIVLVFIAAAIITPSTDMVTQMLVALPLLLLYEISIWVSAVQFKQMSFDKK